MTDKTQPLLVISSGNDTGDRNVRPGDVLDQADATGAAAQFDDTSVLHRLAALPDSIFAAADTMTSDRQPTKAALLSQGALALAILFTAPLRVEHIAALDLDRHFQRNANGRFVCIRIPGSATKSGRDVEVMLDDGLAQRIATHVGRSSSLLEGLPSGALFPDASGRHVSAAAIARSLKRLIANELGGALNVAEA